MIWYKYVVIQQHADAQAIAKASFLSDLKSYVCSFEFLYQTFIDYMISISSFDSFSLSFTFCFPHNPLWIAFHFPNSPLFFRRRCVFCCNFLICDCIDELCLRPAFPHNLSIQIPIARCDQRQHVHMYQLDSMWIPSANTGCRFCVYQCLRTLYVKLFDPKGRPFN